MRLIARLVFAFGAHYVDLLHKLADSVAPDAGVGHLGAIGREGRSSFVRRVGVCKVREACAVRVRCVDVRTVRVHHVDVENSLQGRNVEGYPFPIRRNGGIALAPPPSL